MEWVSSTFPLKTGSEALLLVLQSKNVDTYNTYIKVIPGYFETFVLFAQAPDEGNYKLTGVYSGHTWVCVMVKLILL